MRLGRELTPEEKNFLRIQQSENKITDIKSLLKVLNKTKDEEIDIVYERNGKEKKIR